MRYIVSALILMISLSSGALADDCLNCHDAWDGAYVNQANDQEATAGSTPLIPGLVYMNGNVQEKAANWAIVSGNDSYLYQGNEQYGESEWETAKANGTNLAMIVGNGNDVYQGNYAPNFKIKPIVLPGSLDLIAINHMNELIIMGDYNYADQYNGEKSDLTTLAGTIDPEQSNFGMILGDNNTLIQNNTVNNDFTNLLGGINQTQANAAYIDGFENYVNQSNYANAKVEMESLLGTPSIDQIAKNLAFAISACDIPEFTPVCNNTSLEGECPALPATPPAAPELPLSEYPLDP